MTPPKPITHLLADAALAAGVALVLFFPLLGMVLEGTAIHYQPGRAAWAVGLVFAGRLALGLARRGGGTPPLAAWQQRAGASAQNVWERLHQHQRWMLPLLVALVALLPLAPFATNYLLQICTLAMIYVVLGTGLNIVVGLAGLLDLGYVAFYAVGAYSFALLAKHADVSFWLALPVGGALAAMAGALLAFPVLRMHGDYLAIVTLGFGEIIRELLNNLVELTGGPNGLAAPRPTLFGLEFSPEPSPGRAAFHQFFGLSYSPAQRYVFLYLVMLAFTVLVVWVFHRLRAMPIGRAWEALREDETACKALGIHHVTTKLSAFALGASFGGMAGVFFAATEGFINPISFTFMESAIILAIVVLGGMGSITGVVLAAVLITLGPELFREFESFRMLFFGLAMVGVMVWRPGGLLTVRRAVFRGPGGAI